MEPDASYTPPNRTTVLLLAVVIFIALLPFVNKPYHIDDPFYLWTGQQILKAPLDFYGYTINWSGVEVPASWENKNPPLVSYYMALVGLVAGWGEWVMHLAFMLPAIGVGIGTYFVAGRFCARPGLAAVLAVTTPAFLVSSTNVMAEIVMLCFYVWAVYFWVAGLQSGSSRQLLIGALCIVGATLSKYFGLSLLPLLGLYTLLETRRAGIWIAYLGGAMGLILLYEAWTIHQYGFGLLGEAGKFATIHTESENVSRSVKLLVGMAFAGGCILMPALLSPLTLPWRMWLLCVVTAGSVFFFAYTYPLVFPETGDVTYANPDWRFIVHFTIFATMGLAVLYLPVQDLWRHRNNASLLLALWVFGTFIFACQVNWTINARSLVPMVPATGILLVRLLDERYESDAFPWRRVVAFSAAGLAVSLILCVGDYSLASASRQAATTFRDDLPPHDGQVWFTGHWGFQYYMEEWGAKPINTSAAAVSTGDILVDPVNNTAKILDYDFSNQAFTTKMEVFHPVTVWNPWRRAGFYSSEMGSLPFAVRRIPDEVYNVFLVTEDSIINFE
jgi:4-amino-4-deoxy-L-arabinose transferase-like glycosyltransferase